MEKIYTRIFNPRKNKSNVIKISFISLVLFTLISIATSAYSVSFIEVDRFLCKNQSFYFNYDGLIDLNPLNENTTKLFNVELRDELEKDGYSFYPSFNINTSKNYLISKNETSYELHTDGIWFYISKTIDANLSFDMLKSQYYFFREEVRYLFKYALRDGINKATGLNCISGDYNEMLMGIINIHDYPLTSLNCSYKTGSIYIDCSNDKNISKLLTGVLSDIVYHDRRSYLWGQNIIFVDLDDIKVNQESRFDSMDNPFIVLSEGEFASSLTSGQSVFINHVKYLRDLEKLPIEANKLGKDIDEISNFTSLIYSKLDKIKEKSKIGNDVDTKQYIEDNLFDSNKIDFYLSKLQHYQELYYQSLVLLNENPRYYYEDEYFTAAKRYLADFNSKLIIYQNKLDILRELHDTYNTFTNNVVSDINTKESTNFALLATIYTVLISIILFLIEQIQNRYGSKFAAAYTILIMLLYVILYYLFGVINITALMIMVVIGISIWIPLPMLILVDYKSIISFFNSKKKINISLLINDISIRLQLDLLFNWYIAFSDRELDYKEKIKYKLVDKLKRLLEKGENILNTVKTRKKDISIKEYHDFAIIKHKASLFQSYLEIISSNNKIVKADEMEFNNYSKRLDLLINALLPSRDKKVKIDTQPYYEHKKINVRKNDKHSKK